MGDTGSLIIGLVASILAIKFIELNLTLPKELAVRSVPAVAVGIMIIPLFDTIRVFARRILSGKSPFSPDKTHIHHILLDLGFSHMRGTTTLVLVNIIYVIFVFKMQWLGSLELLLLLLFISVILSQTIFYFAQKRKLSMK
jgi:UDP-GlcNAc:undecaprenyl-phosphate/decaprenyl-phosphate GlcNAc-1-phosphate transferase